MATSGPASRRPLFAGMDFSARRAPATGAHRPSWRHRIRATFFRRQRESGLRRAQGSLLLPPPVPSSSSLSPALSSSSTSPASSSSPPPRLSPPVSESSASQTRTPNTSSRTSFRVVPAPSSWMALFGGLFPRRRQLHARGRGPGRYRSSGFLVFPRHIADVRRVLDLLFYEQSFFIVLTSCLGASHLSLLVYTCTFEEPLLDSPSFLPVLCVLLALSVLTLACRVRFLIQIKSLQAAWWYRPVIKDTVNLLSSPLSQLRRILFIVSFCVYFATLHLVYYQGGGGGAGGPNANAHQDGSPPAPPSSPTPGEVLMASSSSSAASSVMLEASSVKPPDYSASFEHDHPGDYPISSFSSPPSSSSSPLMDLSVQPGHHNGPRQNSDDSNSQPSLDLGVGGGGGGGGGSTHAPVLLRYISVLVLAFLSLLGPHILLLACTCTTFFLCLCGSSERFELLLAEDRCSHGRALPRRLLHKIKEERWTSSSSSSKRTQAEGATRMSSKKQPSPSSSAFPSLTQVLIPPSSPRDRGEGRERGKEEDDHTEEKKEERRTRSSNTVASRPGGRRRGRRGRGVPLARRVRQASSSSSSASSPRLEDGVTSGGQLASGDEGSLDGRDERGRARRERGRRKRRWVVRRKGSFRFFKWRKYEQKRKRNQDSHGEEALEDTDETQVCAICLAAFQENDVIRRLPCAHFFHSACISRWLRSRASCPLRCHVNFFTGTRIPPPQHHPDPPPPPYPSSPLLPGTASSSSSSASASSSWPPPPSQQIIHPFPPCPPHPQSSSSFAPPALSSSHAPRLPSPTSPLIQSTSLAEEEETLQQQRGEEEEGRRRPSMLSPLHIALSPSCCVSSSFSSFDLSNPSSSSSSSSSMRTGQPVTAA